RASQCVPTSCSIASEAVLCGTKSASIKGTPIEACPQHNEPILFRRMPVSIHLWRTSAAALVVALSLASPVAAADARSHLAVADTSAIRIDNFGRVDPFLYRGAQPEGRDYADL